MNPNPNPILNRGNWGRWNFELGGPDIGPPTLAVGNVSCVMSLPGYHHHHHHHHQQQQHPHHHDYHYY